MWQLSVPQPQLSGGTHEVTAKFVLGSYIPKHTAQLPVPVLKAKPEDEKNIIASATSP